jgi:hypothetical protein
MKTYPENGVVMKMLKDSIKGIIVRDIQVLRSAHIEKTPWTGKVMDHRAVI